MRIYLTCDHAGFVLTKKIGEFLRAEGHEVVDMGPKELNPDDDYPDFVMPLARVVASERGSFGIIMGKSGQGEAMAANRIKGARAAVFYGGSGEILTLSREHNDANILSLGSDFIKSKEEAHDAVALWLSTPFSGDERHLRRIKKLDD